MTSRERVLAALNHQEPDRVPVDLSGHRSSGIAAMAYARLRDYLGLPKKPIRVYDPIQQLAIVDEDVLQRFQVDAIELGRAFALEDKYWAEWTLPDGTPCLMPVWALPQRDNGEWVLRSQVTGRVIARMPENVWYFEQTHFPFLEQDDPDHIEAAIRREHVDGNRVPAGAHCRRPGRRRRCSRMGPADCGSRPTARSSGCSAATCSSSASSFTAMTISSCCWPANRSARTDFLDKLMEMHLRNLDGFLSAVGEYIDVILFGDDLGMQSGPQVSPAMYREYFQPREQAMWRLVKQRAPHLKIMLHCCGGVRELLPGLIDAGLDAINPVQITCRGMEPAGLKRDFGSRLTFWGGGCDTRDVLIKGTPRRSASTCGSK